MSANHRDTLEQIFAHPLSHNIEWHAVLSLLREVVAVDERTDGRVDVAVAGRKVVLARPRQKDLDADEVMQVRHILESAGYQPEQQ